MYNYNNIQKIVEKERLEKMYNASFNRCKINDPSISFLSISKVKNFSKNKELSNINFQNYYTYLSNDMKKEFNDYLKNLKLYWIKKAPYIPQKYISCYLIKKFIIDPINGIREEKIAKEHLKENFVSFNIREADDREDINMCYDFHVHNKNKNVYFQYKPISFFKSLNKTSRYSINKIMKASYEYNNPIFLITLRNDELMIYMRNKKSKKMEFLNIKKFNINNLTQEQIITLSKKCFSIIKKEKDNIKKLNK